MLTNFKLEALASKMRIPLVGVFNKDVLPHYKSPGGYIVNLQDSTDEHGKELPGTHWTSFYVPKVGRAAYFDSFGFDAPVQVSKFLNRNYVYSHHPIQNIYSEICGYYCLYFIWFMHRHPKIPLQQRLNIFVNKFSTDVTQNEKILKKLIAPL